jgi:hypothetical protein
MGGDESPPERLPRILASPDNKPGQPIWFSKHINQEQESGIMKSDLAPALNPESLGPNPN